MTLTRRGIVTRNSTLTQRLTTMLAEDRPSSIGFYDRSSGGFRVEALPRFLRRALHAARDLTGHGLRSGQPVLIVGRSPEEMLFAYLATVLAGGVPAIHAHRPAFDTPGRANERLLSTLASLGPEACLATAAAAPPVAPPGRKVLLVDPSTTPDWIDDVGVVRQPQPSDPVHLQMTSGSTACGKPVVVTHEALLANLSHSRVVMGVETHDVFVSWLPLYHDMGLVGSCLNSLLYGADLYLLSPFDFLRDPGAWLRSISELRGTFSCSPDFGFAYVVQRLAGQDLGGLDLSTWRRAICGGEPISADTIRSFVSRFGPHGFRADTFAPSYGLAEATVYVSSWPQGSTPRRLVAKRSSLAHLGRVEVVEEGDVVSSVAPEDPRLVELVALGACTGVDVRLVGEDGDVIVEDDRCGEIVVGGDSVTAGYLRPDGTVDAFDPTALATGDVGFFHGGQLYVVERLKDIVIRNGENYSTRVIEDALARITQVDVAHIVVVDSDVAGGDPLLVGLIELQKSCDATELAEIVGSAVDTFEPPLDELVIVRDGSLPRTTSGKKRHHEVRRALAEGSLRIIQRTLLRGGDVPADVDVVDLDGLDRAHRFLAMVERTARARGSRAVVTPACHLAHDLLLDSLALYELAAEAEDDLGVTIADVDLRGLTTVGDLLALLARQGSADGIASSGLRAVVARFEALPSVRRVVDAQNGRRLRVGQEWLADFASCNYLGLDLHPGVIDAIDPMVREWGVHPSWSRAIASPAPYGALERELAALVGADDAVVFPTVTLLHLGVLPDLAGPRGTILIDAAAHHSLHQAATLARGQGTAVRSWRHGDLDDLERLLRSARRGRELRVIVVDGVYSMSGSLADLPALVALAEANEAVVYVDDAHGIGVLGRDPSAHQPYGSGGGGVARHLGVDVDRLVYVSGLSKAFSSMGAFVACTSRHPRSRFESASTLVFSGPVPTASLASALAGLAVNRTEGDDLRATLHHLTSRLRAGLLELGFTLTDGVVPIVNVVVGGPDEVVEASGMLWDAGVLTTPSVFPASPLDQGGMRFTVTAANDEEQVDQALVAMAKVRDAVLPRLALG